MRCLAKRHEGQLPAEMSLDAMLRALCGGRPEAKPRSGWPIIVRNESDVRSHSGLQAGQGSGQPMSIRSARRRRAQATRLFAEVQSSLPARDEAALNARPSGENQRGVRRSANGVFQVPPADDFSVKVLAPRAKSYCEMTHRPIMLPG